MPTAQKKFYSVKEAARILGVSTNTMYKYLEEGRIKSRRFGQGRFKIPVSEMVPYLEVQSTVSPVLQPPTEVKQAVPLSAAVSTEAVQIRPPLVVETQPAVETIVRNETAETVSDLVTPETTQEPIITDSTLIKSGINDIVFFRIFKALVYLGLGIIYLFAKDSNIALTIGNHISLEAVLTGVLPYAMLVAGILNLIEILSLQKKLINHYLVDAYSLVVSSFYSYTALQSGDYGLFVFTASLAGMAVIHLVMDAKNQSNHTFINSFTRYVLLLSVLGGIVIAIRPEYFPIPTLIPFVEQSRDFFLFVWFLFLFIPPAYILYQNNNKSIIRVPHFALASVFTFIVAIKSLMIPNLDIAYISFISGAVGLFLAWWVSSEITIDFRKIKYLVLSFLWTAGVMVLALYTIDLFGREELKKSNNEIQQTMNNLSGEVVSKLDKRKGTLLTFSGKPQLKEIIKSKASEDAITTAKEIYDQIEHVDRVIVYDADGEALGVYPRNTLTQGANFAEREYFRQTLSSKSGQLSEVFTSIVGTTTVMQTEPVFEENNVIGVIGIATSPASFIKLFNIHNIRDFEVKITDQDGKEILKDIVATHSHPDGIDPNTLALTKQEQINFSRELNNPLWKITISGTRSNSISNLSTLSTSLLVIIFLNSFFSIMVGIILARKKNEVLTDNIVRNQPRPDIATI